MTETIWSHFKSPKFYHETVRKMLGVRDEKLVADFINDYLPRKEKVIVDLGIGTGRELEWLDELKNVSKIIGIDKSEAMLKFCKKVAEKCKKEVILIKDDLFDLRKLPKFVARERLPIIYICLLNTLGNFNERERKLVLSNIKKSMKEEDRLILCLYKVLDAVKINRFLKRIHRKFYPKEEKKAKEIYEMIEYALLPIFWDPIMEKFKTVPTFWYNEKTHDIVVHLRKKRVFISHRFTKEEIRNLHKDVGLKLEKIVEGKLMYISVARSKLKR